jgi:Mn2+/Fe2+ NRAMP family transporter
MAFLLVKEMNVFVVSCLVALLVEIYITYAYVSQPNYKYQYDDTRRVVIGVLFLITALVAAILLNLGSFSGNLKIVLIELSAVVSLFVGSVIVATYMLGKDSDKYKTDWRRTFTKIVCGLLITIFFTIVFYWFSTSKFL